MSKETLIEQLRGYKSTPRHCEELCYEAANEIESMIQKLIVAHEESEFDHSEYKRLREDLRQQLADSEGLRADMQKQLADSEKQVTLLRDAVKFWMQAEGNYDLMKSDKKFQEALAATEPKP